MHTPHHYIFHQTLNHPKSTNNHYHIIQRDETKHCQATRIRMYHLRSSYQAGNSSRGATNKYRNPQGISRIHPVFNGKAANHFPPSREWDHAIDLKPGAPDALDCKVYPTTRDKDTALGKFLDEMVAKGYICPSKSPYASPFFFVKKKDGKLRPVQDYKWLNSHMVQNQYPLPLITQLISDLSSAYIFSKLDIRQGYNNVRIKKGDKWKAAFKTKFGEHAHKRVHENSCGREGDCKGGRMVGGELPEAVV
jgi:hypothetical protein